MNNGGVKLIWDALTSSFRCRRVRRVTRHGVKLPKKVNKRPAACLPSGSAFPALSDGMLGQNGSQITRSPEVFALDPVIWHNLSKISKSKHSPLPLSARTTRNPSFASISRRNTSIHGSHLRTSGMYYAQLVGMIVRTPRLLLAATTLRSYARERWLRRNTRRVYFEVLLAERPADADAEDAHVNPSHHALRFIAINKYPRSELSPRSVQGIKDELSARPGPDYIFGIVYRIIARSTESFWTYRYVRMSDISEGADRYFQLADGTHLIGMHNPIPPGGSDEEYEDFEDEGLEEQEE
ncbi:hypothetical protein CPC08DRAFT_728602 [Agrocybe pediades]|nr:hypothetical protein CPC08DRAFT_728602 [Agrocybe pediades]